MTNKFSSNSLKRLAECHPKLQMLFHEVIKHYDCTILCGYRTKEEQDEAVRLNRSKVSWPNSKHNKTPSLAIDVVPYPVDWDNTDRFFHFAGFVSGIAKIMSIPIRWGGDFNNDLNFKNDGFIDMPHIELILEENDNANT